MIKEESKLSYEINTCKTGKTGRERRNNTKSD